MWGEISGQEVEKTSNADVGLESNNGSSGKSLYCLLVWTCIEKDRNYFLRGASDFRVEWTGKRGRPTKTWLNALVEQSRKFWLNECDAKNHSRW